MSVEKTIQVVPRVFTRREKTLNRQDVKRFEKIGRDHGCLAMEDYANFVIDRIKFDDDGRLTIKSFELLRGLVAFFGNELVWQSTLARLAVDMKSQHPDDEVLEHWTTFMPGWLLVDGFADQHVFVANIIYDRIIRADSWLVPLDDILDQIIDWNHGYLIRDEVDTRWIAGYDIEPEDYLAA